MQKKLKSPAATVIRADEDAYFALKNIVRAIDGEDSDELASMGLKKKSEKRYGIRKTKKKEAVIAG